MKKTKNSHFTRLLLTLNTLAVIVLFLCISATVINPAFFWYISYFGLAYPFIIGVNLIFSVIWLFRKRWYFLISVIAVLIGYAPLIRTISFRFEDEKGFKSDSTTIKLMTYNVGGFQSRKKIEREVVKSQILSLIKAQQPDILAIQEYYTRTKGVFDTKDSILNSLNTKYYSYNPLQNNGYESYGIAIFSKFPIVHKGTIIFEDAQSGNRCEWVDVKKDSSLFRVYAVHLASIKFQPEDYEFIDEVQKDLDTKSDVLSTKRIIKRLKIAFLKRSIQVVEIKKHIAECKIPYIIMGDFNDTPCSYTLAQMTDGIKNGFAEKGSGLAVTYNGDFPNFQIDYILASNQFNFNAYKIIKKNYSDHYPVRCNVTLSKTTD
ncbi:MAG: endonuclease/exonuclease/phosphatase [Sphingobacteriales bacterium]|nr:MAG: endonuclease/exonuclease/phosphatase [Sphingobacteriales bacterium]